MLQRLHKTNRISLLHIAGLGTTEYSLAGLEGKS